MIIERNDTIRTKNQFNRLKRNTIKRGVKLNGNRMKNVFIEQSLTVNMKYIIKRLYRTYGEE